MFTYLLAIIVVLLFWFLIGLAVDLVTDRPLYPGGTGLRSTIKQRKKCK